MEKVFISHSSVDRPFVLRLAEAIKARRGPDVWLDQWEIRPGQLIPEQIEAGLKGARTMILVLSPESVGSRWVDYERQAWLALQIEEEREAKTAGERLGRRLIPVLYRDCEVPPFLAPIRYVRITDEDFDAGIEILIQELKGEGRAWPEGPPDRAERASAPSAFAGEMPRRAAFAVLKGMLPAAFEEVLFLYNAPMSQMPPATAPQVERAIALLRVAAENEGEELGRLQQVILEAAPYLRGRM